jgi:hypothetical protein
VDFTLRKYREGQLMCRPQPTLFDLRTNAMNHFYATDPNILAMIHCGGERLSRNSQAPLPASLEAPCSVGNVQKPASLSDPVNVPRWKSGR